MEYKPYTDTPWTAYKPAIGFAYTMDGMAIDNEGNLTKLPDMDSIPGDMTGFQLMNWINLTSDLSLEGGSAHGAYLADIEQNGIKIKLIYFEQNQRLKQYVYGNIGLNVRTLLSGKINRAGGNNSIFPSIMLYK